MENLREKILKIVQANRKRGLNRREIEKELNLSDSADFVAFDRLMDEMEERFELIRITGNTYLTREAAGYEEGILRLNRKGVGYVDREDGTSIVISPEEQNDALDQDRVLVKPYYDGKQGVIVSVLKRSRAHLIGTYLMTERGLKCVPDDEKMKNRLISVRTDKTFRPFPGLKVLLRVERYGTPLRLYVEEIVGHKDDPGVDIASVLLDYGIEASFPEEVTEEAQAIPQEVTKQDLQGRSDLRKTLTVTIDGPDSKDFDDAVSLVKTEQGWNLKVSIADVSFYVKEGSSLDREAFNRGTSTYVTDRVVPMLPHLLSNGICSLNPNVDRLAITCDMDIAQDGSIADFTVYPSVICSDARLTYLEVNALLNDEAEHIPADCVKMLKELADCAEAIRKNRSEKGAIDFETNEAEIICDEFGHAIDVRKRERGRAERIIEDCMISANVCVAHLMHTRKIPAIYRVHAAPKAKKLMAFKESSARLGVPFIIPQGEDVTPKLIRSYLQSVKSSDSYAILAYQLLRCMQKAGYEAVCTGHFGIAEEEYLHFTSPIRRYPDLAVHRMLRKYWFEKADLKSIAEDEEKIQAQAEQSSVRERVSTDAEYEVLDMKKAEYMQDHIGEVLEGIITSVTSFGFYVELDNTVEGLVHVTSFKDDYFRYNEEEGALIGERSHQKYRIGQKVKVKVLSASKETRSIDFGIAWDRRPGTGLISERNGRGKPGIRSVHDRKPERTRHSRTGRQGSDRTREAGDRKPFSRYQKNGAGTNRPNRIQKHRSTGGGRDRNGRGR